MRPANDNEGAAEPTRRPDGYRAVLRLPETLPPERIEAAFEAIFRLLLPQVRAALAEAEPANSEAEGDASNEAA